MARIRTKTLLLSTGALAGALALGLAAAGATTAALSAGATVPGATITAGGQGITVNGSSTAALPNLSVVPGSPQATAFTVANTGPVPVDLGASVLVTSPQAIKDRMLVRITPVASTGACALNLSGTQAKLDGYTKTGLTTVPAGGSAVLCLEVALDPTAPVALAGQSAAFTVTVTGTSKAR